ncbi:MAG: GAF domain-containing protein [Chloroflexi bacterium]|nr:MAG: GAF domain-containing protein [Chloroflexota bacterium]
MSETQTWRALLAEVIQSPQERRRITAALGVNPLTLTRWIRNEATPRGPLQQRLLEVVPQLRPFLAEELGTFPSLPDEVSPDAIPITFYNHVLDLYATSTDLQRCWSICSAVLYEVHRHFASSGVGLDISVVRCLAPYQGNIVRCLREYIGLGASPTREPMELRKRFFGAESLAGYVVQSCRSAAIDNLNEEQRLPHQLPEKACSAAAAPILHAGRIAGCLLVASTEPDYFRSSALLDLLPIYARLLALAFDPEDFYEVQSIQLGMMPSVQVQNTHFATFQQRISSALKKAVADQHPISYLQAEQRAWWQIAEELLQLPLHLSPEL